MKKNCGSDASNKIKTRLACILEADEFTRLRMGEFDIRIIITKTILQEKGTIHCSTTIWFTSYSYALSYENSSSKGSSGQGMGKIGENFGVELDKSQK